MAINRDNLGLGFDITGDPRDALRAFDKIEDEADRLRAKLKALSGREVFKLDIKSDLTESDIDKALKRDALRAFDADARKAAKGLDDFSGAAKRGSSSAGQFIEAIAQGDPGELLGEIAQNGGAAGVALAAFAISAAAVAAAVGLTTAKLIENERELSKLARDTKLSIEQLQGLQVVANLTGESVEDLAENYKKLSPEVKRMEASVRASGAAIDQDLRQKIRESSLAFEELKLSGTGALNAIGRELLPEVTRLLQDVSGFIRENQAGFAAVGATLAEVVSVARDYFSILSSIAGLLGGLKNLGPIVVRIALQSPIASAIQLGRDIRDTSARKSDAFGTLGGDEDFGKGSNTGAFNVPSFAKPKGGGGSSKKDISELEKELRILRVAEAEARDLLDGRRESAEAYLEARRKVFEAETKLANLELPRERAAKLAEIQQKEVAATREYFETLDKLNKEAVEKAQSDVEASIRVQQQRIEAEQKLLSELRAIDLERRDLQLERRRLRIDQQAGLGVPESVLRLQELQLAQAVEEQDLARRKENHRRALEQAEREFADLESQLEVQKQINAKFEEEERNHLLRMQLIRSELQKQRERENPLSDRSLFGEGFADNLARFDGDRLTAFAATAAESFRQLSDAAGNFGTIAGDAFNTFAKGLGATVEQFVLLGTTGPAALKKLTAQVLAQVAAQAAVKAIFELAEGFAMLFVNPVAAAAHFKAAALYGTVAVVAGVAGRALAGDSFKNSGGAGGSGSGGGSGTREGLKLNREVFFGDRANQPVVVHLRGEYQPGIIVKEVSRDYQRNGTTRRTLRQDISGEGFDVI